MSDTNDLLFACTQNGYVVRVVGRGTINQAAAMREFVTQRLRADGVMVVIDLCACNHLDSTFLGSLATLHQRYNQDSPSFLIYADEAKREALFRSCRLDTLLAFSESPPREVGENLELTKPHLNSQEFGRLVMESHQQLADLGGEDAEAFQRIADRIARELDQVEAT